MSRSTQGPIPDDHFENEPGPPAKEKPTLSRALEAHIESVRVKKPEPKKD
jgi:hypothetical protein